MGSLDKSSLELMTINANLGIFKISDNFFMI